MKLSLREIQIGVAAVIVGLIGTSLLLFSHASTPTTAIEPENGTVSSAASQITDSTASGGKALKFGSGAASGVPAQCASGGTYLWNNLETCGWPGPANTGYVAASCPGGHLAATTLTADSHGVIAVTQNNQTVNCQTINGCVDVTATGVTFTNNLITACDGTKLASDPIESSDSAGNGTGVIKIEDGASATITNNELNGLSRVHACIWHQGTSMTATANNCYGVDDGIFSWADTSYSTTTGDHFTIADNYLHNFTSKTSNGHIDGYQTEGAGNGTISHNTFLMTSDLGTNETDSAVAIWNSRKSSHDITVQNNLIAGGGFAIYAEDYDPSEASPSGGYSVTNIFLTSNKFSTHLFGCIGYYGVWYPRGNPTDKWNRSGNTVLETGFNLDGGNPSYQGASCT